MFSVEINVYSHDQALLHPRKKENYLAITQRNKSNLRLNHQTPPLIKSSFELRPVKEKQMFRGKLQNLGHVHQKSTTTRNYTEKMALQLSSTTDLLRVFT